METVTLCDLHPYMCTVVNASKSIQCKGKEFIHDTQALGTWNRENK